jgi:hypothetical protein
LHQLACLHIEELPVLDLLSFAVAVRYLSSSHALRSLSFGNAGLFSHSLLAGLLATAPPLQLDAAAAALVDWSQPIQLTDLSFACCISDDLLQRCTAIPTLTRLQSSTGLFRRNPTPMPRLTVFAHLQQLRLELDDSKLLPHMAQCNQLRVLELSFDSRSGASAESLCAIVVANAATLEELRFSCERRYLLPSSAFTEGAAGVANWCVLAQCVRLRVLELPVPDVLTRHLLSALAQAPAFQSLELALPASPWRCTPQRTLLRSALSSSSWCSVRLFLPSNSSVATLRSTAGLTKMLPPPSSKAVQSTSAATLRRLRVFVKRAGYADECCFVLRKTNSDGLLEWQCEY